MNKPVLVIMAAGLGSRYGGLKQMDPIDSANHLIIDFSIFDAVRAGFEKVVFIIKRELEQDFREKIGDRIEPFIKVQYVYQDINALPVGYAVPEGRTKPWGTGHAVLSAEEAIDGPFAVINADDYYGREAFQMIFDRLSAVGDDDKYRYTMVGYQLGNTLTENGSVARGVCEVDGDSMLTDIHERTRIEKKPDGAAYTEDDGATWVSLPVNSIVSMNMWGFTKSFLPELKSRFGAFLDSNVPKNPLKSEYFLPFVVDELLKEGKATVKVLSSTDKWYGVTYKEDKEVVVNAIQRMKDEGKYPEELWKHSHSL